MHTTLGWCPHASLAGWARPAGNLLSTTPIGANSAVSGLVALLSAAESLGAIGRSGGVDFSALPMQIVFAAFQVRSTGTVTCVFVCLAFYLCVSLAPCSLLLPSQPFPFLFVCCCQAHVRAHTIRSFFLFPATPGPLARDELG